MSLAPRFALTGFRAAATLSLFSLAGCAPVATTSEDHGATAHGPSVDRSETSATSPALGASSGSSVKAAASATPSGGEKKKTPPSIGVEEAVALLYPEGRPEKNGCAGSKPEEEIRCWIALRYADDKKGLATALAFYDELGSVPGLEHEHVMEGGFRGSIHLVPERPIGLYQKHFDWVLDAQREIKTVFDAIESRETKPLGYRYRPVGWKFMRSPGRTTPSAYADAWQVGYNVSGSLNTSMTAIRDTMVHEIFHLNDEEHQNWSRHTLGKLFDGIVAKCGTKIACLKPYAPMKTTVRGGTYYSFQPDNGDAVHEYSAELASRFFLETRAVLRKEKLADPPFKCGPPENAESWKAIVDEFFGGVDLVPDCP